MAYEGGPKQGKYVGFIRDVNDPQNRGRLRLYVPTVMGEIDDKDHWTGWALPALPKWATYGAGKMLVPTDADKAKWLVWVEFQGGDERYPVWSGLFPTDNQQVDTETYRIVSPDVRIGDASAAERMMLGDAFIAWLGDLIIAIKAITVSTGVGISGVPVNAAQFDALTTRYNEFLSTWVRTQKDPPE